MISYNFYQATDEQTNKRNKSPITIPPACRRAGVQTAQELMVEETMLMDYEERNAEKPETKQKPKIMTPNQPLTAQKTRSQSHHTK